MADDEDWDDFAEAIVNPDFESNAIDFQEEFTNVKVITTLLPDEIQPINNILDVSIDNKVDIPVDHSIIELASVNNVESVDDPFASLGNNTDHNIAQLISNSSDNIDNQINPQILDLFDDIETPIKSDINSFNSFHSILDQSISKIISDDNQIHQANENHSENKLNELSNQINNSEDIDPFSGVSNFRTEIVPNTQEVSEVIEKIANESNSAHVNLALSHNDDLWDEIMEPTNPIIENTTEIDLKLVEAPEIDDIWKEITATSTIGKIFFLLIDSIFNLFCRIVRKT